MKYIVSAVAWLGVCVAVGCGTDEKHRVTSNAGGEGGVSEPAAGAPGEAGGPAGGALDAVGGASGESSGGAGGAEPVNACPANAGCDVLTTCEIDAEDNPVCGACPDAYTGEGVIGCTPTLLDLTPSTGTLGPSVEPLTLDYRVVLGLGDATVGLTPVVPEGATVTIDGQPVESGQPWPSPVLDLGDSSFDIVVGHDGHERTYTVTLARGSQHAYIKASNTGAGDRFGDAIAIDGDTLVIGAPNEASKANTINGDQTDDSALLPNADIWTPITAGAGAVYVFVRSGDTWSQQAYLKASNAEAGDQFGIAVAISGDTIVVGARWEDSNAKGVGGLETDNTSTNSGAAYVFKRSGTTWTQQAYLKASNTEPVEVLGVGRFDEFGSSVTISGDTLVVGADGEDGGVAGVGANQASNTVGDSGAAYVFTRSGSTWTQQEYLKAGYTRQSDEFGWRVALDADTVVVGAWRDQSSATGIDGNPSGTQPDTSGAAYIFARNAGTWTQQAYVKADNSESGDDCGHSVAISGDTVVIGCGYEDSGDPENPDDNSALESGSAIVVTRSGTTWTQQAYLKASNPEAADYLGWGVAIDGDTIVLGAQGEASNATGINGDELDNSLAYAGAAYLFTRTGNVWNQSAYIKASNPDPNDSFGLRVAISGGTVVIGARGEASNATGFNGDEADNSLAESSAVYVFQ